MKILAAILLMLSLAWAGEAPRQRDRDPRLALLEDPAKLCPGRILEALNATEVQALSGKLQPGDQLLLSGSEWKDARFHFSGTGTQEKPIFIHTASAIFSGASSVTFSGSHLIISGLEFRGVAIPPAGLTIFRLGNGKLNPADHCIVHKITIDGCNSANPADWPKVRVFYMNIIGEANTVADCTFANMNNFGQMLAAQELPPNSLLGLHLINNRFLNRPFIDNQNGYEVIQIGWSGERARPAGALLEGNIFKRCDGENELITLKASDIIVRNNQFLGCQGVLCLRTADRVLVEGNLFDGEDRPNTGGIRIQGADHVITGNTFRRLRAPSDQYYRTLSLMAASAENTADDIEGYGRAKNIQITRNRFENNDTRLAAGIYPRPEYPLLPQNIRVENNTFIGGKSTAAFDYLAPDPSGELLKNLHESGNQFLEKP